MGHCGPTYVNKEISSGDCIQHIRFTTSDVGKTAGSRANSNKSGNCRIHSKLGLMVSKETRRRCLMKNLELKTLCFCSFRRLYEYNKLTKMIIYIYVAYR
jgi:hypothetical protein